MNKTDRLLAIVLELQAKRALRAEDLAALFETSVRTIYRDIQALSEAGIPIIGTTGQGYSLVEGYFLPPVRFTIEEAVTLLIGTEFIEQQFDEEYREQARLARKKIEVTLSDRVRDETSRVHQSLRLLARGKRSDESAEKENLKNIRRAILDRKKIRFGYTKKTSPAADSAYSQRTVDPYGLVLVEGAWMLVARCDLRQGIRHFRLSRIEELTELEETFEFPADFDLKAYAPSDDRSLAVTLRFDPSLADKVRQSNFPYIEETHDHLDGLDVVLRAHQPDDLLQWVLGWGAGVVVLEPESFRQRVREEARKILKRY